MSWFADLAGRAETLLNNLDEQTGAVLRNNGSALKNRPQSPAFTEASLGQRKRLSPKLPKRNSIDSKSTYAPAINHQSRSTIKGSLDNVRQPPERRRRSPARKPIQHVTPNQNGPKPLSNDYDHCGLRKRRFSLPTDLELVNHESLTYDLQNLEVENAMLKNELNVVNREVADLIDTLKSTEDELNQAHDKLETLEKTNQRLSLDKEGLLVQLDDLRSKIEEVSVVELSQYRSEKLALDKENTRLQEKNSDLENVIRNLTDELHNRNSAHTKIENDLRHAQMQVSELEQDCEKRQLECIRLEREWEAYKLRVKSMLTSKDNEIKSLREGSDMNQDTKDLIEEIDKLKDEREELSQILSRVKSECSDMKKQISQLESRHSNAERVVTALRDAMKEERAARNKAEAQVNSLSKELKSFQFQTGQTIVNLRTALHDKEEELMNLKEASSDPTSDTSALNVGDYDVMHSIENEKIQFLTQTVVQKQGKIDALLADNNMLKIQLDKLESKYKSEMAALRANSHSIIHLQEERRTRTSSLAKLSLRMGLIIKRFPILRIFIVFYMIGLHFWVMTVLLSSTPENYIRPSKS